jgi:hypothetical protein
VDSHVEVTARFERFVWADRRSGVLSLPDSAITPRGGCGAPSHLPRRAVRALPDWAPVGAKSLIASSVPRRVGCFDVLIFRRLDLMSM